MRSHGFPLFQVLIVSLVFVTCAARSGPARAHNLVVFAAASGTTIEGEAYTPGDVPVRDAQVTLLGPGGQVFGETTTGADGRFTFSPRFRCDHKVLVEAGDGHSGEYTLAAEELPDHLPIPDGPKSLGSHSHSRSDTRGKEHKHEGEAAHRHEHPSQSEHAREHEDPSAHDMESLGKQITALRRDFHQYHHRARLQDIVGGIGWILGITGVAFYFLGSRRREAREAAGDP